MMTTKPTRQQTLDMLLELADLLESLPHDRFDYSQWVGEDWQGDADLSCGTVACAGGWATTLPSFRAAGLVLSPGKGDGPASLAYGLVPGRGVAYGLMALDAALALGGEEASYLFVPGVMTSQGRSPRDDATAVEVAQHIRGFVEDERLKAGRP